MSHGWFIALAFQIALWMDTGVRLWMESLTRDGKARNPVTTTIIGIMIRIVVWTMMLLSILANLGVDITAMIASLGVGGIAIALAVQTLLSDIFRLAVHRRGQALRDRRLRGVRRGGRQHRAYRPEDHPHPRP